MAFELASVGYPTRCNAHRETQEGWKADIARGAPARAAEASAGRAAPQAFSKDRVLRRRASASARSVTAIEPGAAKDGSDALVKRDDGRTVPITTILQTRLRFALLDQSHCRQVPRRYQRCRHVARCYIHVHALSLDQQALGCQ